MEGLSSLHHDAGAQVQDGAHGAVPRHGHGERLVPGPGEPEHAGCSADHGPPCHVRREGACMRHLPDQTQLESLQQVARVLDGGGAP